MKSIWMPTCKLNIIRAKARDVADVFPGKKAADYWHIECLWVAPAERRKGIGAALIRIAISEARVADKGIICQAYPFEEGQQDGITGQSTLDRQKYLVKFYRKLGFKHVGDGWMILQK